MDTADWLTVRAITNEEDLEGLTEKLDRGEAEAILLAKEIHADLFLIDEAEGRRAARKEGLNITGLGGVLVNAKRRGLLEKVEPALQQLLRETKFRLHESVVQELMRIAGE